MKFFEKLNDFLDTNIGFTIGFIVFIPICFAIVGLGIGLCFKLMNIGL